MNFTTKGPQNSAFALIVALSMAQTLVALPGSGLGAWELDDNADFPGFQAYLSSRVAAPHENLDVGGRIAVHILDASKRPVPFALWRATEEGVGRGSGRAFSDGSFALYPASIGGSPKEHLYGIELSARGASTTATTSIANGGELDIELPGALPLTSPIACDVVFVIDTTISMKKYLEAIKLAVVAASEAIASFDPPLALRVGVVLYRDRGDDYLVKATPLSPDLSTLRETLSLAVAKGGGDIPEDLGAGLRSAVTGMDFAKEGIRLIFAFTDALPSMRPGPLDSGGARYSEACVAAMESGIKIYTIGLGTVAMDGSYALRQIAQYTGAAYLAADLGEPATPPGGAGLVRGALETLISRIVQGEARAGQAAIFDTRPPVVEKVQPPVVALPPEPARDPALVLLESVQAR
ncbi:MAG: vWA domain-containing protein, partial [Spirochaetota bacterium]